jgi:hypothetical protein
MIEQALAQKIMFLTLMLIGYIVKTICNRYRWGTHVVWLSFILLAIYVISRLDTCNGMC